VKRAFFLSIYAGVFGLTALASAQPRLIHFSSGTGFYVSKSGHIITNHHVVRNCQSITTRNGEDVREAKLLAVDAEKDLAILKVDGAPPAVAPLRWNLASLRAGQKVAVIGYPGAAGARGEMRYGTSVIMGLQGPAGEPEWVQIKPILEQGNSGGPLLDVTGNVIGVVTGKTQTFRTDTTSGGAPQLVGASDVAVTLSMLKGFLDASKVRYFQSSSGLVAHADSRLGNASRRFVVQVRCITGTE
jgi:S1-C subfamily serine protease